MSDQESTVEKKMTFKEKLIEAFSIDDDFTHRFFYMVNLSGFFGALSIINTWFRDWIANPDKILQMYLVYILARLAVAPVMMMFYKFFHEYKDITVHLFYVNKYTGDKVAFSDSYYNKGIWEGIFRIFFFFAFNLIFTFTLYKAWVEPRHLEEYIFFGVIYTFSLVIPLLINYVLVIKLVFYIPKHFKTLKDERHYFPIIGFPIVMILFVAAYYYVIFH